MNGRVRLTISMQPEVLEVFRRMSEVSGLSVGRCIGDWCGDTVEGAAMITKKLAEAREAPARVMREFHQLALGMADEVRQVQDRLRVEAARKASGGGTERGSGSREAAGSRRGR